MSPREQELSALLAEHGLRTTDARLAILEHVSARKDHPTAEEILEGLRSSKHKVGTATLYQNLGKFAKLGLLSRVTGVDGCMHFDGNVTPHPHLVCRVCGRIVDAELGDQFIEHLRPKCPHTGESLDDWQLETVEVELYGICPDCQSKH